MQRKNKAMIAAAIGMVAIVVATTAVRCSIAHTAGQPTPTPPAASLEQPAEQEARRRSLKPGEETDGASGPSWRNCGSARDRGRRLGQDAAFREGSSAESDGASVSMTAFEVEGRGLRAPSVGLTSCCWRTGTRRANCPRSSWTRTTRYSSVACDGFSSLPGDTSDGDVRRDGRGDGARRALPVIGGRR